MAFPVSGHATHSHRPETLRHRHTSSALPAVSGYDQLMIEKDRAEPSEATDAASVGSSEMAEALKSIKSASPSLAGEIDAAQVTPESLVGSHDRATVDEHGTAQHAAPEQAEG